MGVPVPLPEVFEFFSDARNLEELTPPWLKFEVLTPAPIEMRVGLTIDYRLKVRGLPLRWQSEIAAWDPPHRFVDVQVRGPYRYWHHEHSFREIEGGTAIMDVVDYRGPGWFLEPLVNSIFLRPDVHKIFAFRHQKLVERFGEILVGDESAVVGA
jgi:ligand-binding SRPBCC domain-containing protein